MDVQLITNPKTQPPGKGPYIAVRGEDGKEKWLLLADERTDGITDADFDFDKGKKWAAEQRKKDPGGK